MDAVIYIAIILIWIGFRIAKRVKSEQSRQQGGAAHSRTREEQVAEQRRRAEAYRAEQGQKKAAPARQKPNSSSATPVRQRVLVDGQAAASNSEAAPAVSVPLVRPQVEALPLFSRNELVNGIIMSELLGPCKAKRRH